MTLTLYINVKLKIVCYVYKEIQWYLGSQTESVPLFCSRTKKNYDQNSFFYSNYCKSKQNTFYNLEFFFGHVAALCMKKIQ